MTWLLVVLLLVAAAGQAAASLGPLCRDTAICCCTPSALHPPRPRAAAGDSDHASPSACCDSASSRTCDFQDDAHPAAAVISPPAIGERLNTPIQTLATAIVFPSTDTAFEHSVRHCDPSDRGRPPRYIEMQTLLC
jgi:hypothetical protein